MSSDGSRDAQVEVKCASCGKSYVVRVWARDLRMWREGEYVQVAFPYLSPGERELLVSSVCNGCFDAAWREDV